MTDGLKRYSPPRWLAPMNRVFILLNRFGLGPKGMSFLTVPGRVSGKPRTTPLSVFSVDSQRYVVGGFPGADWVANARSAGQGALGQGSRRESVKLVELSEAEAKPILRVFPEKVPTSIEFMTGSGLVTSANPDEFEALAGRCAVFRIEPLGGQVGRPDS